MRIWSILLIKSDLKWCIKLSSSPFLYSVALPTKIIRGKAGNGIHAFISHFKTEITPQNYTKILRTVIQEGKFTSHLLQQWRARLDSVTYQGIQPVTLILELCRSRTSRLHCGMCYLRCHTSHDNYAARNVLVLFQSERKDDESKFYHILSSGKDGFSFEFYKLLVFS